MMHAMREARILAVLACLALVLVACSRGKDFPRPDAASLRLGQTTTAELIAQAGPPAARAVRHSLNAAPAVTASVDLDPALKAASVAGTVETLTWHFARSSPNVLYAPTDVRARQLTAIFWNDHLIYYNYTSSFANDSSNFDENRAMSFARGQATPAEVVQALGPPSGEAIYPYIAHDGGRLLLYDYLTTQTSARVPLGPARSERVTQRKLARLLFDPAGRLIDSSRQTIFVGS
jgi:hypothetical protein